MPTTSSPSPRAILVNAMVIMARAVVSFEVCDLSRSVSSCVRSRAAEDSYGNSFLASTENSVDGVFTNQFQKDYGFAFNQASDATGAGGNWTGDIQKLLPLLQVIDNNSATSIGGGGTPRQPIAPAIARNPSPRRRVDRA